MRAPATLRAGAMLAAATIGTSTVLMFGIPAAAHVTVNPREAAQGAYTKVAFRMPNEKDTASTVKLEVNLPAQAPIASVSLKPVAGWTAVTEKTKLDKPIQREGGEITEAVTKITWTAEPAAVVRPGQFQEFEVSLGPLPEVDQIVFKALQTYSDGDVVRWIEEPAGAAEGERPAPVLKLTKANAGAPAPAAATAAAMSDANSDQNGDENSGVDVLGIVGVLLGLAGLAAGLLAYRKAS